MAEGIRIALKLKTPRQDVWNALTQPDQFKAWFSSCQEIELELRPGGRATFAGGGEEGSYRSEGTVLDVVEGRKLLHTVLEGHDPVWYGALLWHLEDAGEETKLVLAEAGFQGHEEEVRDIEQGWRALLLSLVRFLEKSDRAALPEEYYDVTGQKFASAFGYSYAPLPQCWERVLALHGAPKLEVGEPCALLGDFSPQRPGAILDVAAGKKLMYSVAEDGFESVACFYLEDMGSETKISYQRWGYEERPEPLAAAQRMGDELMDRIVAGLDTLVPHARTSYPYNTGDMEGAEPKPEA